MMSRKKFKTLMISFSLAVAAVCLSFAFAACSGGGDGDRKTGNYGVGEEGIYYYDATTSAEYLMTLQSGTYMISVGGASGYSGTYSYDEEGMNVSFTGSDGSSFEATFSDDVMQLSVAGTPYTFLKKVDYAVKFVDGSTTIETQSVTYGKSAEAVDKEKSGYIFIGWYEDAAFTTPYKFNTAVTGDTTLYAYYIEEDSTISNFDITYISDGEVVGTAKTQNGMALEREMPEVEGILGWWVSDTNDESELTYKYDGQVLKETTNLYAVKESALGASVYADRITWEAQVSSVTITIDGEIVTSSAAGDAYSYDMSALGTGKHTVEVSASGYGTENLVYVVNKLARVSNFAVYGSTLVYNRVENAQYYYISVTCANPAHDHTMVYNGNTLTYDFSNCEMGPDGITFTVYAYGAGYETSVSETFVYALILDGTTVKIDSATDTASWTAVAGATGYEVYVNGEYVATTTDTEYSLKYYDRCEEGETIGVQVKPVAPGYYSEISAMVSYTKTTLRAPEITEITDYCISWTEVEGASGYEVSINGYIIDVYPAEGSETAPTKIYVGNGNSNGDASEYYSYIMDGMNVISVEALSSDGKNNSQFSDAVYATELTMYDVLSYKDGVVSWTAALAASEYTVEIDGEVVATVSGANTYDVTFTHGGENTVDVYFTLDGVQSAMAEIRVTTYAIVFDSRGGDAVETMYVAKGDRVYIDDPTYSIGTAEFMGWYTLPDLEADENSKAYGGDGVKFESGSIFEYDSTLVLYAFWKGPTVAVTLYAGDGGVFEDGSSVTVAYISLGSSTYDIPVATSTDPAKVFTGWFASERSSARQYTDSAGHATTTFNNSTVVELFAHYGEMLVFSTTTSPNDYSKTILAVSKGADIASAPDGTVTIPAEYELNGVTYPVGYIGSSAFSSCSRLVEVNIPDTVEYISTSGGGYRSGTGAFAQCTMLQRVNVYATDPDDVNPAKVITYYSEDGVLFERNSDDEGVTLILYPHGRGETSYTIPAYVSNESEYVYEGIEAVKVERRPVTKLADQAFSAGNSSASNRFDITEITIPYTVSYVGMETFYYSDLEKVTFTEAESGYAASLSFGDKAFEKCTSLTDITLPSHLTAINFTMFDDCDSLTEIKITSGGEFSVSAEGLILSDGGTTVVFCLRNYAGELVIDADGSEGIASIGESAFMDCVGITGIEIGKLVAFVGVSAFEGCTGAEYVVFDGEDDSPDLTIKTRAFYGLTNSAFTSLALPSNLITLEKYAFGNCTKLDTVYFDAREKTDNPDTLGFEADAFATTSGATYLKNLYLGKNVPEIEFVGVFGGKLAYVWIEEGNDYYSTDDQGVVYDAGQTKIIFCPPDKAGDYIIPDTVQTISDSIFSGRTEITSVTIPASVTYIGYRAFYQCTSLTTVTFVLEGGTELGIADQAFYGCSKLETVTLPYWLNYMGEYTNGVLTSMKVFNGCSSLENVVVDETYGTCENYVTRYGVLYAKENGEAHDLIFCPRSNGGEDGLVIIPETVVNVVDEAFYGNRGITTVRFENDTAVYGVTFGSEIAYSSGIEEIVFPVGMTNLNTQICRYATSLKKVTVPYTVETIDYYAFYNCTALTEIVWGDVPVPENSGDMHDDSSVEEETTVPALRFVNTTTNSYCDTFGNCSALTEISLPERTTELGVRMFYSCTRLETVHIGKNVTTIPQRCFYGCTKLTAVNFDGGEDCDVETIESYAFTGTGALSLTMPYNLKTIESNAFTSDSSKSASSIVYVKFNKNLSSVGSKAFYGCTSLKEIIFETPEEYDPALSLEMTASNIFYNAVVETVTLPYYMTEVGGFYYCRSLVEVDFMDAPEEYILGDGENGVEGHTVVMANEAFKSCLKLKTVEIPWYVSSIGDSAFSGDTVLESVAFDEETHPSVLTDIGYEAFYNAKSNFVTITLPASIETIGEEAFDTCTALTTVNFGLDENGCSSLNYIADNAFLSSGLTAFVFPHVDLEANPDGIKLGNSIFKQCKYLKRVTLSNGIQDIGTALNYCYSIEEFEIDDDCNFKASTNGSPVLYSKDGTQIVVYGEISGELVIESGVTAISSNLFMYQNTLKSVVIPETVEVIDSYAFYACTALTSVTFASGGSGSLLRTIGENAFELCTALKTVEIPDSVETIGAKAFYKDTALENMTIPVSVEKIGESAFDGCTGLETVDIRPTTLEIGKTAFNGCTRLTSVTFPTLSDGEEAGINIGESAFAGCTALKTLNVSDSVKSIGTKAFQSLTGLETVALPGSLETLGNYAFDGCSNLKSVTFADTSINSPLKEIGQYAFQNCTSLTTITIPDSVGSLGIKAFSGDSSLEEVKFGENDSQTSELASLATYTFASCTSLKSIILPYGINLADSTKTDTVATRNYSYDFSGCSSLETVVFLGTPQMIGNQAFANCTSLKTLAIGVGASGTYTEGIVDLTKMSNSYLGISAFQGSGVVCVILPCINYSSAYYTTAMTATFSSCASLESVTFDGDGYSLTMSQGMFNGCSALKNIVIPEGATLKAGNGTSSGMFAKCTSLETIVTNGATFCKYDFHSCGALRTFAVTQDELVEGVAFVTSGIPFTTDGNYMFYGCTSLETVVLPVDCTQIPTYMFYGCTSLSTMVTVEDYNRQDYETGYADLANLTSVSSNAFTGCAFVDLVYPSLTSGLAGIFMNCTSLKTVTFPSEDITLAAATFAGCTSLETVTITSNLTISAGSSASTTGTTQGVFAGSGLKTVILDGVTSIPNYTFYGCYALTTLTSVTNGDASSDAILSGGYEILDLRGVTGTIGQYSFAGCTAITCVLYPSSTASGSGTYQFQGCTGLKCVLYPSDFQGTACGYMFYGCTALVTFGTMMYEDGEFKSVVVEEGVIDLTYVTDFGTYAFYACTAITRVVLPEEGGVTIPDYLFWGCQSLKTIGLSSTAEGTADLTYVVSIGTSAFQNTAIEKLILGANTNSSGTNQFQSCYSLKEIELTESLNIGKAMFAVCTALEKVTAGEGVVATVAAGSSASAGTNAGAFDGCEKLETFDVTVAAFSAYMFYGCITLKTIKISEATEVGNYAFYGCESITDINSFPFTKIGTQAFAGNTSLTSLESSTITEVGEKSFYQCTEMAEVSLPSATSVGANAFDGCTTLTRVNLPAVESLGNYSFQNCTELADVEVSNASSLGSNVFYACVSLKEVDVSNATGVGNYDFSGCSSLEKVYCSSATSLGTQCFANCTSLTYVETSNVGTINQKAFLNCEALGSVDLESFTKVNSSQAYIFQGCLSLKSLYMPNLTTCNTYAFAECTSIEEVTITSLTTLSTYAFQNCTSLKTVYLSSSLTSIPNYAFSGCTSLTSIDLSNVGSIGTNAFEFSGLTSVELSATLSSVGNYAFAGCHDLAEITVGVGNNNFYAEGGVLVDYVNGKVVSFAGAVRDVVIPDGVVTIGSYSFYGANIDSVTIPGSVTTIDTYAFQKAEIKSVVLSEGLTTIGNYAFNLAHIEEAVVIPVSVTKIGDYAFSGTLTTSSGTTSAVVTVTEYSGIKDVVFAESTLTGDELAEADLGDLTIGKYAFAASSIEEVVLPDRLVSMDTYAFCGTTYLRSVTFGAGLSSLPDCAFMGSGITELYIPGHIASMGKHCFAICESLETAELGEGFETVGQDGFYTCTALAEISMPESLTTINSHAFENCSSLRELYIPANVTTTADYMARYCDSLESVVFEEGFGSMTGAYLFASCPNLVSVTLPSTLIKLTARNFDEDYNLKSIIVPSGVTSFADNAFMNWTEGQTIFLEYGSEYESLHSLCTLKTNDTVTTEAWKGVVDGALICYYSDSRPAEDSEITYWHYAEDGETPVIWEVA